MRCSSAPDASPTAQKRHDSGASDTEIRIGDIAPYSGPASAYGVVAKTITAYFNKVSAQDGINGRRVRFISGREWVGEPRRPDVD